LGEGWVKGWVEVGARAGLRVGLRVGLSGGVPGPLAVLRVGLRVVWSLKNLTKISVYKCRGNKGLNDAIRIKVRTCF